MSPRFVRRWCAVLVVAALAIVLPACAGGDDTILTVNGWTLGRQAFLVELDEIARNPGYHDARRQNGQTFKVFKDGSTEEYTPEFVAEFLNERVTFQLAAAELERRKVTVTEDDRRRAVDIIVNGLSTGTDPTATPPGSTPSATTPPGSSVAAASGQRVLDGFRTYRDVLVTGVATLQVLQRELSKEITGDDKLPLLYEQTKDRFAEQACARHILVRAGEGGLDPVTGNAIPGTEVEYAAALDVLIGIKGRLDAGEDFATVAAEVSQDVATKAKGGDLGCAARGQFAEAFDTAVWSQPVGQMGAPIKSTFGYHLVLVTERRVRSFDEVKGLLVEAVAAQSQEALQQWLATATTDASVTVDAKFGTWNRAKGAIDPVGSSASLSLVPDAGSVAPSTSATSTTSTIPAVPRGTR